MRSSWFLRYKVDKLKRDLQNSFVSASLRSRVGVESGTPLLYSRGSGRSRRIP